MNDQNKSEFYFFDTAGTEKFWINCGGAKEVVFVADSQNCYIGLGDDDVNTFPIPYIAYTMLVLPTTDERLYVFDKDGRGSHIYVWVIR